MKMQKKSEKNIHKFKIGTHLCASVFPKKEHRNFLKFCVACNVRLKTRSTSYKRLASTPTGPICSGFD